MDLNVRFKVYIVLRIYLETFKCNTSSDWISQSEVVKRSH